MAVTPWDPETHYRIEEADDPRNDQGLLVCEECGASVVIDADPETPGVDDLAHEAHCSQRWAKSAWWREHL